MNVSLFRRAKKTEKKRYWSSIFGDGRDEGGRKEGEKGARPEIKGGFILRKYIQAGALFLLIFLLIAFCGSPLSGPPGGLAYGRYYAVQGDGSLAFEYVELNGDGSAQFCYAGCASDYGMGHWEVLNDQLVITEDFLYEGAMYYDVGGTVVVEDYSDYTGPPFYRQFYFDIDDGALIFRQDLSFQLWDFSPLFTVKQGTVLVYTGKGYPGHEVQ